MHNLKFVVLDHCLSIYILLSNSEAKQNTASYRPTMLSRSGLITRVLFRGGYEKESHKINIHHAMKQMYLKSRGKSILIMSDMASYYPCS